MPGFVPDASATLPWRFEDEATPWTEALLDRIQGGEEVRVPAHWPLEVANALLIARRRGRVTAGQISEFIGPGCRLVFEAPRQRGRGVRHETGHQYLWPSWIRSLIFRPPSVTPLRDSLIWATASAGVLFRWGTGGSWTARVSRARVTTSSGEGYRSGE